jgi:hypothetical protein
MPEPGRRGVDDIRIHCHDRSADFIAWPDLRPSPDQARGSIADRRLFVDRPLHGKNSTPMGSLFPEQFSPKCPIWLPWAGCEPATRGRPGHVPRNL